MTSFFPSRGKGLAQDLKKEMKKALIIKEGTLYPILRKLREDGLLTTKKKELELLKMM